MWEIARVARYPHKRIFYIAPSYRQAKQIIWQDLREQMYARRWVRRVNESDLTIELVNGSRISLRSADNPDSMRGVSLDFAVLDECAFMSAETWTQVIRPTLSDRQGGALFISTPQGMGNWFYDLWLKASSTPDWSSFQFTTLEGGNVPASEIEAARRDLDLKTFEAEYEAKFTSTNNNIFYAFAPDNVVAWTGESKDLIIGMDFNVGKMCASIGVQTRTGIHITDEIVLINSNTDEMCQEIQNRYPGARVTVFPDPAGSARKTSAVGRTDHMIIQGYGFTVKAPRAHPAVKDRNNAVNRLLCDATGERNLSIDPKCRETITCLSKHAYKPGSNIPDKDSGYDHMTDAVAYMVNYLYPIRRPVDTNVPQSTTWGVF